MSKKKRPRDLTTEGLAKRLFPKEVREEIKRETREKAKTSEKKGATKSKGS